MPALIATNAPTFAEPPRPLAAVSLISRPTVREGVVFGAGLIVLFVGQLWLSNSLSLFGRHFWLDEMLTHAIVSDPDPGRSLRLLQSGADTHPPTLYFILRAATLGGRFADEATLRVAALVFVLVAMFGLYLALRDSCGPGPSIVGCLAVWCHPLILSHAFEARFYGAWLCGAVWYAYALRRACEPGAWRKLSLALLAVFLCTIHYFGIITFVLITSADWLTRRVHATGRYWGAVPAALGPIALAACLPLLLQQRSAYTLPTWVPPPTAALTIDFVAKLLLPLPVVALLLAAGFARLLRRDRPQHPSLGNPMALAVQAGLLSLALLPLVLIAFAYLVQPVLVDRYGLPAVAALAPVVALASANLGRICHIALCGALIILGGREMGKCAAQYRQRDAAIDAYVNLIDTLNSDDPVVFENANNLFTIHRYAPKTAARCFLLDIDKGDAPAIVARDLVRQYVRLHPTPAMIPWSQVQTLSRFYLVTASRRDQDVPLTSSYPSFSTRPIWGQLFEMSAQTR